MGSLNINRVISISLLLLLMAHLVSNLERVLYVNELFSGFGLFILLNRYSIQRRKTIDRREFLVLMYLGWGAIFSVVSFFVLDQKSLYTFLRTLPIFYSAACFFSGIFLYSTINKIVHNRNFSFMWVPAFIVYPMVTGFSTFSAALIPWVLSASRRKTFFFGLGVYFITFYLFAVVVGTQVWVSGLITLMFCVFFALMFIFKWDVKWLFDMRLWVAAFIVAVLGVAIMSAADPSYYLEYSVGRKSRFSYGIYFNDNALWRLMLWGKLVKDNALVLVTGVGFGVPLYDFADPSWDFVWISLHSDQIALAPWTMGPHNSFVHVLVRLGLPGLILVIMIISGTFYALVDAIKQNRYKPNLCMAIFFSLALVFPWIIFNVGLGSPLWGGTFWILLGIGHEAARMFCVEPDDVIDYR